MKNMDGVNDAKDDDDDNDGIDDDEDEDDDGDGLDDDDEDLDGDGLSNEGLKVISLINFLKYLIVFIRG